MCELPLCRLPCGSRRVAERPSPAVANVTLALRPGLALGWLGLGVIAFLIWAAFEKTWPFGPREIREQFLVDQPSTPERGFEGIMPSSPPA